MRGARIFWWAARAVIVITLLMAGRWQSVAAGGTNNSYRVLKPIQSGDLTLFPVVRNDGKVLPADQFLTLDEGLKSGEVEVAEAGSAHGLARSRGGTPPRPYEGDQVNTLVLVNNSRRPLLLLAGEIVTGGKQDRIIAKDRIVPAGGDPIDLSVFCIEHGRWTESSPKFGSSTKVANESIMVQPAVRQQAMVAKDQQQVWNSVSGAISSMAVAAAPSPVSRQGLPSPEFRAGTALGTTSYAKAMQTPAVSAKVDQETAVLVQSREQALATLRDEHAVGVVVAVRGEVIWADIFSDPSLLARYWTKLVRSYAAEELGNSRSHAAATMGDAQLFLDSPLHGTEESQGQVGVYRYREVKSGGTDQFTLEALLPDTGYDVHVSRLKLQGTEPKPQPAVLY